MWQRPAVCRRHPYEVMDFPGTAVAVSERVSRIARYWSPFSVISTYRLRSKLS
jgi:hypothetical protein